MATRSPMRESSDHLIDDATRQQIARCFQKLSSTRQRALLMDLDEPERIELLPALVLAQGDETSVTRHEIARDSQC